MENGAAVMGIYKNDDNAGTVFTVGNTDWAKNLNDPKVAEVTRNILNELIK